MPKVNLDIYGKHPRLDGKPGSLVITPTRQGFIEADGGDVRLNRVTLLDPSGQKIHSYLLDPIGRRFVDNLPGTEDDLEYLERLRK